jgi:hypothetical protein
MNAVIQVSLIFFESLINPVTQDICVYLIYVVIVLIVSYGNRDINSYYMKVSDIDIIFLKSQSR